MTGVNRFANAWVEPGGHTRGDDDGAHCLFQIAGTDGPLIYGEYVYAFLENKNDFNIEIDQFGFPDYHYIGSTAPAKRLRFSAEESAAAEQLIRAYFLSRPKIFADFERPISWATLHFDQNGFSSGRSHCPANVTRLPLLMLWTAPPPARECH